MSSPGQPRLIDPRGHRFGAAFSVVLLVLAFVIERPVIVAAVGLALGVSAWFGTRYSILGRPWPYVRKLLKIGPPKELEVEWPPRFAQAAMNALRVSQKSSCQHGTSLFSAALCG